MIQIFQEEQDQDKQQELNKIFNQYLEDTQHQKKIEILMMQRILDFLFIIYPQYSENLLEIDGNLIFGIQNKNKQQILSCFYYLYNNNQDQEEKIKKFIQLLIQRLKSNEKSGNILIPKYLTVFEKRQINQNTLQVLVDLEQEKFNYINSKDKINNELLEQFNKLDRELCTDWITYHSQKQEFNFLKRSFEPEKFDVQSNKMAIDKLKNTFLFPKEKICEQILKSDNINVDQQIAQFIKKEICFSELQSIFFNLLNRGDNWETFLVHFNDELCVQEKKNELQYSFNRKLLFFLYWTNSNNIRQQQIIRQYGKYHPVPLVTPNWDQDEGYQINKDIYHIHEDSTAILNIGIGDLATKQTMGKSLFLNDVFDKQFQIEDRTPFFNKSIDIDYDLSFRPTRELCFIDVCGSIQDNLLQILCEQVQVIIVQVVYEDLMDLQIQQQVLEIIQQKFPNEQQNMDLKIILVVRDCGEYKNDHFFSTYEKQQLQIKDFIESKCSVLKDSYENDFLQVVLLENLTEIKERDYCKLILEKLKIQVLNKIMPVIPLSNEEKQKKKDYFRKTNLIKIIEGFSQEFGKQCNEIQEFEQISQDFNDQLQNANKNFFSETLLPCRKINKELKVLKQKIQDTYDIKVQQDYQDQEDKLQIKLKNIESTNLLNIFQKAQKSENSFALNNILAKLMFQHSSQGLHSLKSQKDQKNQEREKILKLIQQKNLGDQEKKSYDLSKKEIIKEIQNLEEQIENQSISIEIVQREYGYLMESTKFQPMEGLNPIQKLFDFVNNGENFELIDGDNMQIGISQLQKLSEYIGDKKILVLSILGPQSSGKSTLLNYLFGCQFTSSIGRCSRGVYGSLAKVDIPGYDQVLILDSEGLQDPSKQSNEFDIKIVLFCIAVSQIVLFNFKGEINQPMKHLIESCLYRLNQIPLNKRMQNTEAFMVFNQNPSAHDKIPLIDQVNTMKGNIMEAKPEAEREAEIIGKRENVIDLGSAFFVQKKQENRQKGIWSNQENKQPLDSFAHDCQNLAKRIFENIAERGSQQQNFGNWLNIVKDVWNHIQNDKKLYQFANLQEIKQDNQLQIFCDKLINDILVKNVPLEKVKLFYDEEVKNENLKLKEDREINIKNNNISATIDNYYQKILKDLEDKIRKYCQKEKIDNKVELKHSKRIEQETNTYKQEAQWHLFQIFMKINQQKLAEQCSKRLQELTKDFKTNEKNTKNLQEQFIKNQIKKDISYGQKSRPDQDEEWASYEFMKFWKEQKDQLENTVTSKEIITRLFNLIKTFYINKGKSMSQISLIYKKVEQQFQQKNDKIFQSKFKQELIQIIKTEFKFSVIDQPKINLNLFEQDFYNDKVSLPFHEKQIQIKELSSCKYLNLETNFINIEVQKMLKEYDTDKQNEYKCIQVLEGLQFIKFDLDSIIISKEIRQKVTNKNQTPHLQVVLQGLQQIALKCVKWDYLLQNIFDKVFNKLILPDYDKDKSDFENIKQMYQFSVQSVNSCIMEVDSIVNYLNQDLQYFGLSLSENSGYTLISQAGMSAFWLQQCQLYCSIISEPMRIFFNEDSKNRKLNYFLGVLLQDTSKINKKIAQDWAHGINSNLQHKLKNQINIIVEEKIKPALDRSKEDYESKKIMNIITKQLLDKCLRNNYTTTQELKEQFIDFLLDPGNQDLSNNIQDSGVKGIIDKKFLDQFKMQTEVQIEKKQKEEKERIKIQFQYHIQILEGLKQFFFQNLKNGDNNDDFLEVVQLQQQQFEKLELENSKKLILEAQFQFLKDYLEGKIINREWRTKIVKEQQQFQVQIKQNLIKSQQIKYQDVVQSRDYECLFLKGQNIEVEQEIQNLPQLLENLIISIKQKQDLKTEKLSYVDIGLQDYYLRYRNLAQGCKAQCKICHKKCDISNEVQHDKHKCSKSHYIRGMTGTIMGNQLSNRVCDEINKNTIIKIQKSDGGHEFKSWEFIRSQKVNWDFDIDENDKDQEIKDLFAQVWNKYGQLFCDYFGNLGNIHNQNLRFQQIHDIQIRNRTHYIMCLDDSGSMAGSKFSKAKSECLKVIQTMQNNHHNLQTIGEITVIVFCHIQRTVIGENGPEQIDYQNCQRQITYSGGGTDFNPVLQRTIQQIQNYPNYEKHKIFFFTDGYGSYDQGMLKQQLNYIPVDTRKRIEFHGLCEENIQQVQQIHEDLFNQQGSARGNIQIDQIGDVMMEILNQDTHDIQL